MTATKQAAPHRPGPGRIASGAPGGWPTWGAPRRWATGCSSSSGRWAARSGCATLSGCASRHKASPGWDDCSTTGERPSWPAVAVVILLGLVYPWGNVRIVQPLLRALAWAGSLLTVVGVAGLILMIRYFVGDLNPDRLVDQAGHVAIHPATFVFVYVLCFLVLGLAFGVTAG